MSGVEKYCPICGSLLQRSVTFDVQTEELGRWFDMFTGRRESSHKKTRYYRIVNLTCPRYWIPPQMDGCFFQDIRRESITRSEYERGSLVAYA